MSLKVYLTLIAGVLLTAAVSIAAVINTGLAPVAVILIAGGLALIVRKLDKGDG